MSEEGAQTLPLAPTELQAQLGVSKELLACWETQVRCWERRRRGSQEGGRCHLGSPGHIPGPAALWATPKAPQQIPCSSTKAHKTPRGCWHLGVLLLPPLIFEGFLPPRAWVRARSLLCRLLLSEAAFGLSMSIFGHPTSIYGHLLPCPDVAAGGALFSAHTAQLLGALITPVQNPSAGR